jgi:hypothetical protein
LAACKNSKNGQFSQSGVVTIDSAGAACPFLTKDQQGNIVLSYTRNVNDSVSVFCYAISTDQGKTFSSAVEIPGSTNVDPHGENMPKVVFKPSGEIIALWGSRNPNPVNKYSGLVYFAQSFDNGKTWNQARRLVNDTAGFDQRYFDVAVFPDDEVGIVWLDNRKSFPKEGSAIYFSRTAGRQGFQSEKRIGESCCQCCRTDLFVDAAKNIHIVYRGIINDSIRDMVHMVSTDMAATFSPPKRLSQDNWVINGCPHTGPAIAENSEGLHFTWFTMGTGNGLYYCNTKDHGKTFSPRDSVRITATARHPQIASLPGGETFIVWDETVPDGKTFNSSIGIQQRSPEGKPLMTKMIPTADGKSSFPVIQPVSDNSFILSYNQVKNDKSRVVYETITF